jgi:glutamine---fructose-6-phosphate transaminase (isomerizing)
MTRFLQDILRQPDELRGVIEYLHEAGRPLLEACVDAIRDASHVYVTGIGASWNAALSATAIFHDGGRPVYLVEASELLVFGKLPSDSVILILSRSGKSVEVVKLLAKAREAGATVIGITHFEDGPLAQQADIPFVIRVRADHGISVNTYSGLAVAAAAVASATVDLFDGRLVTQLRSSVVETAKRIPRWRQQLDHAAWLLPDARYYFLARGSSLASAYEACLMWEEGTKTPAKAMSTGGFRHGPQEVVTKDMRAALWLDPEHMRSQDLAVASDLRTLGASVMLVGCEIADNEADLVFRVPQAPRHWQFVVDIFPAQLAAERLAKRAGVDCDSFRFASYIVEDDEGLLRHV